MLHAAFTSHIYSLSQRRCTLDSEGVLQKAAIVDTAKRVKKAFHGSPHRIDTFRPPNASDQAAMLFGHGLYFTAEKTLAERYRMHRYQEGKKPSVRLQTPAGILSWEDAQPLIESLFMHQPVDMDKIKDIVTYTVQGKDAYGDLIQAEQVVRHGWERPNLADTLAVLRQEGFKPLKDGFLYEVSLALDDDATLLWDLPWDQQPIAVQKAVKQQSVEIPWEQKVGDWYHAESQKTSAKEVSQRLERWGIDGFTYEDPKHQGAINYVVLNPSQVTIHRVHDDRDHHHTITTSHDTLSYHDVNNVHVYGPLNKKLKEDIQYLYKREGISPIRLVDDHQESPLIDLLVRNFQEGKPLLEDMMLYRGTKDLNASLGSFDGGSYLHTTPWVNVARGYALTTNNDIGFNPKATEGVGRVTAYALPPNAVFHSNFGLEEGEPGYTRPAMEAMILPVLTSYLEHPSDETHFQLSHFLQKKMYEVAIDPMTPEQTSYLSMGKVDYPWVDAMDSIQARITDINHASLINYGCDTVKIRYPLIDDYHRFSVVAPEVNAQLVVLQRQIHQTIEAYQTRSIPHSASLKEAEKCRQETLKGLHLHKIGQSDGSIGFKDHPELSVLHTLTEEFNTLFQEGLDTERAWVQTHLTRHGEQFITLQKTHQQTMDGLYTKMQVLQEEERNQTTVYQQKSHHLQTLLTRIRTRETDMAMKKRGLFGWWYGLTGESNDAAALAKDKKYYQTNKKQWTDIKNTLEQLQQEQQSIHHLKQHHTAEYDKERTQNQTQWSSFVEKYDWVLRSGLGLDVHTLHPEKPDTWLRQPIPTESEVGATSDYTLG